jgi:ubiquinone/menaquinone biosynthesis C-methylase UbiE
MENKKYIPALGYDFLSEYYDLAIKITMPEKKFRNRLIDWLGPLSGESILEFGFGTAQNLILLKERKPEALVQGVDVDPKIKAIAEYKLDKHNLKVALHLYDGNRLPFADNSFDKIFSSLVFHQLDAFTKHHCLLELHRVLKPNGKLLVGDWGAARNKWIRFSFYAVQLLDGFKTTSDNIKGFLPQFISDAGFYGVSEVDYINTKIGTYCYYTAIKQ